MYRSGHIIIIGLFCYRFILWEGWYLNMTRNKDKSKDERTVTTEDIVSGLYV